MGTHGCFRLVWKVGALGCDVQDLIYVVCPVQDGSVLGVNILRGLILPPRDLLAIVVGRLPQLNTPCGVQHLQDESRPPS